MDGGRRRVCGSLGSLMGVPGPGSALISFKCERPDHAMRSPRYTLTIHQGKWAFCLHEGPASNHRWRAISGARIDTLFKLRRSR